MKKKVMKPMMIMVSILLLSVWICLFVKFTDHEVIKFRFERHGAYGYEVMITVSESGELDVFVSKDRISSSDVDQWIHAQATHKSTTISTAQLEGIKKLAREAFWKECFFMMGIL